MAHRVAINLVVGVEALAAAFISLIAFLMSGWMVDDDAAFRMTDSDWMLAGCLRFLFWSLVGAVFACIAMFVNRRLGLVGASGFLSRVPVLMACFIALASGMGARMFVIDKPYI
jgi:hypothetical protein